MYKHTENGKRQADRGRGANMGIKESVHVLNSILQD